MLKAFKYRLYPNEEQVVKLAQTFGCARLLYNNLLAWWKNEYQSARHEGRSMERLPLVTFFKKEFSFMKDVDSLALMNARRNFEQALENFFKSKKGKRKGRKLGFPVFKKKGVCKDSFQTNNVNNAIRVDCDKELVKLPKLGWLKCRMHRDIPQEGKLLSCTVTRAKDGKYYISILAELPTQEVKDKVRDSDNLRVVGLDMSLSNFVVDSESDESDDTKAKYVRQYRKNERKLRKLGRRLSRKEKGSKNRAKARARLASKHAHVANCRKDFVCKQALHYAREFDAVVIEDLDMQAMAQALRLGKSVNDLGWGMFKARLAQKCEEYGTELVVADKWFASSKTCNACGEKNDNLQLSDRVWVCPHCGSVIDRDYNAACNLRDYYFNNIINSTAGTAETYACGDTCHYEEVHSSSQAVSLKQEAPPFRKG